MKRPARLDVSDPRPAPGSSANRLPAALRPRSPRPSAGRTRRLCCKTMLILVRSFPEWRERMRSVIVFGVMIVSSTVFGQECLRPEWTKCVAFPNGGSHTGMSIQRERVQADVTPGPDICVVNQEEIGGHT